MKLIALTAEHVESQKTLPFDLFDGQGRLLLAANESVDERSVREWVRRGEVFAEARSLEAWRRRVMEAADSLLRRNAQLSRIARATPEPLKTAAAAPVPVKPGAEWAALVQALDAALRQPDAGPSWLARVLEVHACLRALAAQRLDEALFHFIYQGARHAHDYSSHQALRCMLVAGAVARELGWEPARVQAVEKAALTMNVALRRLQDRLALQPAPGLEPQARAAVAAHAEEGARLLAGRGVDDPLWLEAVRLHHDAGLDEQPLPQLAPGPQLAALLRRVDVYCAVLSRRAYRGALTSAQAARRACLGADGRPDLIGAALLKAMGGLYPPGSFVQLATQEAGVVISRGARISQPLVAVLVNAQGEPQLHPRLRLTALPGCAVRAGLRPEQVAVEPSSSTWSALHVAGRKLLTAPAPAPAY